MPRQYSWRYESLGYSIAYVILLVFMDTRINTLQIPQITETRPKGMKGSEVSIDLQIFHST